MRNARKSLKSWFGLSLLLATWSGLFIGCSKPGKPVPATVTNPFLVDELEEKYHRYKELYSSQQDASGYISSRECDSLLFTGLLGAVLPEGIDIRAAEKSPGEWTRRPLVDGKDTCYPESSKSTISRDMFTGLFWYAWRNQRLDILEDIWDYGVDNSWVMGSGAPSRIYLTPNARGTLAEAIYRLGGDDHFIRSAPQVRGRTVGVEAVLDYLSIQMWAEMRGGIHEGELDLMAHHAQREPRNALARYIHSKYTDGIQDAALKVLLDTSLFPEDRLPTTLDRGEPFLWIRDDGKDWQPKAGEVHTHPGADFLYVAHMILKDLGRL